MKISVLTIFPEMFEDFLQEPVIKRAVDRGIAEIGIADIKKYAGGSFRHIDDDTYGGGAGMVMRAKPILDALKDVCGSKFLISGPQDAAEPAETGTGENGRPEDQKTDRDRRTPEKSRLCICAMTPSGIPYTQKMARELAEKDHLVLICGHYEGIDERVMRHVDRQISIGDYVLTGGELPAKVVMDSVIRLLGGVLREESTEVESFEDGLLEYPQYTKPLEVDGQRVPDALLTGDHEKIRTWRLAQSLLRTLRVRPDLLEKRGTSSEERKLLEGQNLTEEERIKLKKLPDRTELSKK